MRKKTMIIVSILIVTVLIVFERRPTILKKSFGNIPNDIPGTEQIWIAPDSNLLSVDDKDSLIRYGKELITHTAVYFGPRGKINRNANGLNCEHCHIDGGTRAWGGNFSSTAALYPKFSARKNGYETINQRISDCFERSLNGRAPDSSGKETLAMIAYIKWLGKDVPKGKNMRGSGLEVLPGFYRSADPEKGRIIYTQKCASCHMPNGTGQPKNEWEFLYPPLWGQNSYNVSAGIYRLSKFAGFIKANMPLGSTYKTESLSYEEAWDVAAYVNSQPRPVKKFADDWPDLHIKPFDIPFGPYLDSFSEQRHKFGPSGTAAN